MKKERRKMKKILALVLVLTMAVGMLAGCGTKNETGSDNKTEQTGGEVSGTTEEVVATKDYFPLAEKEELSIWYYFDNNFVTDPNELWAIQWLEEQTNVHVNFQVVTPQEAQEKFGLMLASGDYPDILRGCNGYYPGGMEKAVDEGVAVELTDLIPKYMPNYQAIRTSDAALEKDTKTDEGKLVAIWSVASNLTQPQGEPMWSGLSLRGDWLDELGMEVPTTIAEWDTVLRAFKENYGCEAPLMLAKDGTYTTGAFVTAYGIYPEWYQKDGQIQYGPMQDEYKEYLELMAGWYADGLIDPNFITNDGDILAPGEYMGTGRGGAGGNIWNFAADTYKQYGFTQEEDYYLASVPNPSMNKGELAGNAFVTAKGVAKEAHLITTNCENVELALRWMDMFYEEDVMVATCYGKEGETYVVNEDGSYSYTDVILNNPEYTGMDALKAEWVPGTSNMGLFNWAYYKPLYAGSEAYQAVFEWDKCTLDGALSNSISMTDAESANYATAYTDIKTYVDEMTVKFIMGSEPLDKFEEFRSALEGMGVDDCAKLWQSAYDRYVAR